MFSPNLYEKRRRRLMSDMGSGLILFLGNTMSPMESKDNCYRFHQDSSFVYFFGIDLPNLAGVLDADDGTVTVFGDDLSMDDWIWTGSQPSLALRCNRIGVDRTASMRNLEECIEKALSNNRPVHYLPSYRCAHTVCLAELFGIKRGAVLQGSSSGLIRSVVAQRSVKSDGEIKQIQLALAINRSMQIAAMQQISPGRYEREVVGEIEGLAFGMSGRQPSFTTIFSIHGHILHNHCYHNQMSENDLVVCDCGARSPLGYASDTTRTIPVGGRFTSSQKEIYDIVLGMQKDAISVMKPGIPYRDAHEVAARRLSSEFKALGLLRGTVDQIVATGAYALFFPHGLGHMLGLDVHDMESLGEDYVGYTDDIRRDDRFGINRLRLARMLEPGFVVTVEPGIYFIPQLIEQWRSENRFGELIDYRKLKQYFDFGGIRIEDDVLVTEDGATILEPSIPKSVSEVEHLASIHPNQKS